MSRKNQESEEEYAPSRKEVLVEMSKRAIDSTGRALKYMGDLFAAGATISTFWHALPTSASFFRDIDRAMAREPKEPPSIADYFGLVSTLGGITTGVAAQAVGYTIAAVHGYEEALLIPVATNITSGVYEYGKSKYPEIEQELRERKMQREKIDRARIYQKETNRLLEKMQDGSLEEKIQREDVSIEEL